MCKKSIIIILALLTWGCDDSTGENWDDNTTNSSNDVVGDTGNQPGIPADSSTGVDTGHTWPESPQDTGPADTGPVDTGPADTGPVDTGPVDTGPADTGPVDTGPVDTGPVDTGPVDTGPVDTGQCHPSPQNPPANMRETIELTWKEMTGGFEGMTGARPVRAGVQNFHNLIWDQLFDAGGELQFCIRWESSGTLSLDQVAQIEDALERWADTWFKELAGYNCWPYDFVPITVTGVAVAQRNQALWDDSSLPVYVGDYREDAPQCPQACGRFFNQNGDYSRCSGGEANRYDMSLWLTDGFRGGVGGDWGQRMSPEGFMRNMSSSGNTIWVHEFGHGLGFPDYYNWHVWAPGVTAPVTIMNAGSARDVNDWDRAMIRYSWDQLQNRLQ